MATNTAAVEAVEATWIIHRNCSHSLEFIDQNFHSWRDCSHFSGRSLCSLRFESVSWRDELATRYSRPFFCLQRRPCADKSLAIWFFWIDRSRSSEKEDPSSPWILWWNWAGDWVVSFWYSEVTLNRFDRCMGTHQIASSRISHPNCRHRLPRSRVCSQELLVPLSWKYLILCV